MTASRSEPPDGRRSRGTRIVRAFLLSLAGVIGVMVIGFVIWAKTGVMQAESRPVADVRTHPGLTINERRDAVVMAPTGPTVGQASSVGLVFIPGAKVAPDAYLYKLSGLVEEDGLTVVITKPILNLAFFDLRSLSMFTDDAPGVTTWYVGGHSLGGVRACLYARQPDVKGLILFGSVCANDVSKLDLQVLSISGSQDGLSTPQKIAAAADRLPADATFVEIDGLNHAGFGDYGDQPGDGQATVSDAKVRSVITSRVESFLQGADPGLTNP